MKRIISSLISCAFVCCFNLMAQNETITLKDGTLIKGYISKQDFTKGKAEISFSEITMNVKVSDVLNEVSVKRDYDELSEAWKVWAAENNKLINENGKKYLRMASMVIPGYNRNDYVILERGTKSMKCFTISDGVIERQVSDIYCIQKTERNLTLLTDIDDIIKTDDKSITGVILEQYPGIQVKIWDKNDGNIHIVNYNEIRSIGKAPYNPDYSIWEQSPYLDRLITENGTGEEGLIIENGLSGDVNLVFATPDGKGEMTRQYAYKDIKGIRKSINKNYKPLYDIILSEGESRINRDSTINFATIKEYQYMGPFHLYYLESKEDSAAVTVNTKNIVIETNTSDISDVYVFKGTKRTATLTENKEQMELYTYTYADLFQSDIDVKKTITINGTTKLEFTVPDYGEYFVYLRNLNKCWFFKCCDPVMKEFITANVFPSKLNRAFENIAQLEEFEIEAGLAKDIGYPADTKMGKWKSATAPNSRLRENVLSILKDIPDNLLKFDDRDAKGYITRYYLEKDNAGNAYLMSVNIGQGPNDLGIMLFAGTDYECYQNVIHQISAEYNEKKQ